MREIKFRAWDKGRNVMIEPHTLWDIHQDGQDFDHESFSAFINRDYKLIEPSDIEFMQFTGLKDKNGAEIYEGDIVRGRNGDIYPVVYENGGFRTNGVIPHPKYFSDDEVIGNIYESPELLSAEAK